MARTFSVARHLIRQFFLFLNPASGTSAESRIPTLTALGGDDEQHDLS